MKKKKIKKRVGLLFKSCGKHVVLKDKYIREHSAHLEENQDTYFSFPPHRKDVLCVATIADEETLTAYKH